MSFFDDDSLSHFDTPSSLALSNDQLMSNVPLRQSIDFLLDEHAEDQTDADEDHYSGVMRDHAAAPVWAEDDEDDDDDEDNVKLKKGKRRHEVAVVASGSVAAAAAPQTGAPPKPTVAVSAEADVDNKPNGDGDDDNDDNDDDDEFVPELPPASAKVAPVKKQAAKKSRTATPKAPKAAAAAVAPASSTTTMVAASGSGAGARETVKNARVTSSYDRVKQCAILVHDAQAAQAAVKMPATSAAAQAELARLERVYGEAVASLTTAVQVASDALSGELLSPQDMERALWVKDEAVVLDCQCKCLVKEASEMRQRPTEQPLPVLALAITAQPFPLTMIQNKAMDDAVVLRLLRGTKTEIVALGEVAASMIVDFVPRNAAETEVQNNVGKMSAKELEVRMEKLKFKHGTRKKRALLKFRQQVQVKYNGSVVSLDVESNASKPFVIKTNERQWRESEQSLLMLAAFGGRTRCPFAQVYNAYHHHIVGAVTKQLPSSPQRALSALRELPFIASNFFGNAQQVTQTDFNTFWTWVGPTEHKLAHQRDLSAMFVDGVILGFVTRAQSIELLRNRDPGVFLIRFSLKYAGEFAVSYRTLDSVKHYAIKQNDVVLAHLADFLLSSEYALRRVLAVDTVTDTLLELDARSALRKYCSSNRDVVVPSGYEEVITQRMTGLSLQS
jgi:hypothetical protein